MAITALSTNTPYCSVAQFLALFDWRPVAQLMNDANSNAVTRDNLLDATTTEGARLLEILQTASGEIEGAVMIGGKMSPTDLAALTGASASFLRSIVADLAIGRCYLRRPADNPWAMQTQTARQLLNALAQGEMIFGTQEAVDASLIDITADLPSNVENRNGMVVQMQGYFGTRGNRRSAF